MIEPLHVAAYVEQLGREFEKPTVKQHLAAVRMLFDWLAAGGVLAANPAAPVRGPKHVVKRGRTRQWMLSAYKLRIGGVAAAHTLTANMILTFPFKGGSGRFRKPQARGAITIEQMIRELQRFADDEPRMMAIWFREAYMRQVDAFRSNRKRLRVRV